MAPGTMARFSIARQPVRSDNELAWRLAMRRHVRAAHSEVSNSRLLREDSSASTAPTSARRITTRTLK